MVPADLVVQAVEHARHLPGMALQYALQPHAQRRPQHFARVGGADRGHLRRIRQGMTKREIEDLLNGLLGSMIPSVPGAVHHCC